ARAASWLVPECAEFVHLPNLESLIESRAKELGRLPFTMMNEEWGIGFRRRLLEGVVQSFDPHAIVVEYRPLGDKDELGSVLHASTARKYLLLRGILDTPENVRAKFLESAAGHALETCYDRIFVATDKRICDIT